MPHSLTATAVAGSTRPEPLTLSRRDLRSFSAQAEKKILVALARRLPRWVSPDHLTLLGAVSMAGAGLCYRLLALSPLALLGVNLFLFLNWFGDSLDGTLARVRERQRPRYGFFVDHLADAFGAIALLVGFSYSGLVPVPAGFALLIAYLLLQIHIALKAHTTRVFQIAFFGVGGTEARIILGALNLALLLWPAMRSMLEPLAWLIAFALTSLVVADGFRTGRSLDREERALWPE